MTSKALRYLGNSIAQGLIGYAALLIVFEGIHYGGIAFHVRRNRKAKV